MEKRKPGRPQQRDVRRVIVHDSAFERAKMLGSLLGIHRQQALGMLDEVWFGYLRSVRVEDVVDGMIYEPLAKEKLAGLADYADPERFFRAMVAVGLVEDQLSPGMSPGITGDPPTARLRLRGASVYQEADDRREYQREKKRKQRRHTRKTSGLFVPGTNRGQIGDIPEDNLGNTRVSRPPVGRSVGSNSDPQISNPTDRPSPAALSLNSRGTPPVPLATANSAPAPKRSVDVGKMRREKKRAARTSTSAYAVTVEADPFETELDDLLELEAGAKGIPAPRLWADRPDAFEALRGLRARFAAEVVQNAFTAFLRDSGVRDRRLIVFLLSPRLHLSRLEKAKAELEAIPEPLVCVACGDVADYPLQAPGFSDVCYRCAGRFERATGNVVGAVELNTDNGAETWEAWLAGEHA